MPIVFATNFSGDRLPDGNLDYASVIARYPGSVPYTPSPVATHEGWSMSGRGNNTSDPNYNRLCLPIPKFTGNRIEIVLGFGASTFGSTSGVWNILGLEFRVISGMITVSGIPIAPSFQNVRRMHIICEEDSETESWSMQFFTDTGIKVLSRISAPMFTNEISSPVGSHAPGPVPAFLTSVVVAYDTPPGTRISNVNFADLEVSATTTGDFQFSDQGFDADVSKINGLIADPNVFTTNPDDTIVYEPQGAPENAFLTFQTAGQTENPMQYLDIQTTDGMKTFRLLGQRPIPTVSGTSASIALRNPSLPVISQLDFRLLNAGSLYEGQIPDLIANNRWRINTLSSATRPSVLDDGPFTGTKSWSPNSTNCPIYIEADQIPDFGARPFTLELWANRGTTDETSNVYYLGRAAGSNQAIASLLLYGISTSMTIRCMGATSTFTIPGGYAGNTWALLGISYDGEGNLHAYFNGQLLGSMNIVPTDLLSTDPLVLGSFYVGGNAVLSSRFSDFRLVDGVDLYQGQSYTLPSEPWPNP